MDEEQPICRLCGLPLTHHSTVFYAWRVAGEFPEPSSGFYCPLPGEVVGERAKVKSMEKTQNLAQYWNALEEAQQVLKQTRPSLGQPFEEISSEKLTDLLNQAYAWMALARVYRGE